MRIFVAAKAKKFEVVVKDGRVLVKTRAPASDNKANFEIIKEFKKIFKEQVFIVKGAKSREKELQITNFSDETAFEKLNGLNTPR